MEQNSMQKYLAEALGTFVLVVLGCGTAVAVGCNGTDPNAAYFMTAVAFGLAVVAMAYSVGNVSGCHINPAISLAMVIDGRLSISDFVGYVVAQCVGAVLGCIPIGMIAGFNSGFGANVTPNPTHGLLVEIVLTFVFVYVVLGATDRAASASTAGLAIGLSLILVHLMGIAYTGTSVNPARSFGPAIMNAIFGGSSDTLSCLWVFIVGPLVGGALAAVVYRALTAREA